jgi:hypothetical protein
LPKMHFATLFNFKIKIIIGSLLVTLPEILFQLLNWD